MDRGDMLVKLYHLNDDRVFLAEQKRKGISVRKPLGGERQAVIDWVRSTFGEMWVDETKSALMAFPTSCFIALQEKQIIGFSCYDATALGFCGPIGVDAEHRGQGTGAALLLTCLLDMKSKGYGYAVIGWVGREACAFYQKIAGATSIPDSFPGVYENYINSFKA